MATAADGTAVRPSAPAGKRVGDNVFQSGHKTELSADRRSRRPPPPALVTGAVVATRVARLCNRVESPNTGGVGEARARNLCNKAGGLLTQLRGHDAYHGPLHSAGVPLLTMQSASAISCAAVAALQDRKRGTSRAEVDRASSLSGACRSSTAVALSETPFCRAVRATPKRNAFCTVAEQFATHV
ncbi:hypothetical protein HPB48_003410 [Haemaphysalis longicornis]|uniref:Uncharacterized protein n=1 Tax=Haemaphysalis longicornis TaxID=44386 RepID=A0A9J6FM53_HAELO|nr:hypothetical protein HPB48_003410 [Haemaphysalis longicornis]